jgi:4-amino-4-deoxy-L-arabinose transferase-like glycosyltransferase
MPIPPLSFTSMRTHELDTNARRAAWGVLAIAIAVRLVAAALVPLVPDETYYWEWSRHLAAGYLDHPPAIALVIRLGTLMLGDTMLGVRIGSVVAGALASVVLVRIAGSLGGDRARLRAAAIIACMPLAQLGLALATPDATLLLCWALALAALVAVVRGAEEGSATLIAWAMLGLALGTALSTKYTAFLLIAGIAIALVANRGPHRSPRCALRTGAPLLALAAALAIFAPNLIWNSRHHWLSFAYQLAHGLTAHRGSPLTHEAQLLGGQLGLVSPLLFAVLAIPVWRAMAARRDDALRFALAMIAAVTWLAFVVSALRSAVEPNWQAPAYLSAIVLAATYDGGTLGERWRTLLRAACALGAAMTIGIYAHAITPFVPTNVALDPTLAGFGWDTVAAHVELARADASSGATSWVAGERYQEASELAFHLPDHPVTFAIDIHARASQYDLWPPFPRYARTGDRLVLVLGLFTHPDDDPVIAALRPHFDRVTLREVVALKRGSIVRAQRRIWVLDGWRGSWPEVELAR